MILQRRDQLAPRTARKPAASWPLSTLVRRHVWLLLTLPALLFILTAFLLPIGDMLLRSLFDPAFTLEHYRKMVSVDAYARVLANTFRIALIVTTVCLFLGYLVAYALVRARGLLAAVIIVGVVLPLWTSDLVRTFAWTVILGRNGPLNGVLVALGIFEKPGQLLYNDLAVIVGSAHIMLPFMILPLYTVMKGIDLTLLRAANSLGANPLHAFLSVFLPLSAPGIVAGCLLVFVLASGLYVTPAVLGGQKETMIAMLIETQARRALNWGFSAALAAALLVATCIILWISSRIFRMNSGLDLDR